MRIKKRPVNKNMSEKKLSTLLEIIKYSTRLLNEKNIKNPRLNVELMFCEILNCDRIKLYLDFDKPLKSNEISGFKDMLLRRLKYEPLQYILGKTCFYGYQIALDRRALIPRQETEILVGLVLDDIAESKMDNVKILEIGTGSGCIAVALSRELDKKGIKHKISAVDKSRDSVELAENNAKINSVSRDNVVFAVEDFLNDTGNDFDFNYIISNPPYISQSEIENLDEEILKYEPVSALTDGKDGLLFYDKIFNLYSKGYIDAKVFLEIGDGKKNNIEDLLIKKEIKNYKFYKDYCNIERVLKIG